MARRACRDLAFIFLLNFTPSGAAMMLAAIITSAGSYGTWPVKILPDAEPIDDSSVMASDVAIVTRVGIFKITSMIGTMMNAPPAPTMPAARPTMNAALVAMNRLNVISSIG